MAVPPTRKGRDVSGNCANRYDRLAASPFDDGWESIGEDVLALASRATTLARDASRSAISWNSSPGLDFETRLTYKPDIARLLERELRKPGYTPRPIALGSNTDPYQPIERGLSLTRSVLEVLERFGHPLSIVTKSAGVTRDLDILSRLAGRGLVRVWLSVTTLDSGLARRMEPCAATPSRRLATISALVQAGVPCGVLAAPMSPGLPRLAPA